MLTKPKMAVTIVSNEKREASIRWFQGLKVTTLIRWFYGFKWVPESIQWFRHHSSRFGGAPVVVVEGQTMVSGGSKA